MKIVRERQRCMSISYSLCFRGEDCGYGFPCDEYGNLVVEEMNDTSWENYYNCIQGRIDVEFTGVEKYVGRYTRHAIGVCDECGEMVHLDGFTNTCEGCGSDYDIKGTLLAPRDCWGEETSETLVDIFGPCEIEK